MKGLQSVCLGFVQLVLISHLASLNVAQAAPSIEACPQDSILLNDDCVCIPESCAKPPCLSNLVLKINGTDEPGSCCPIYSCEGCHNETLLNGKCPCAPEATLNDRGLCECVDKDTRLVDGECVCNPHQCELPQICDRKSVLTTIEDGCCKKTQCIQCPDDSESTMLESDDLEDHCVCLPCKNDCGVNETVVIKKRGSGFPGNCCDLYECKQLEPTEKECTVDDIIYRDGDEWDTSDKQRCICHNGLSLCSKIQDNHESCFSDGIVYKHNQSWMKDDGCTNCTCIQGREICISHYCDFIISKMKQNDSHVTPCLRDNKIYEHLQVWQDGCEKCTCSNGEVSCDSKVCTESPKNLEEPLAPIKSQCQPLFNCNKLCHNGFRLNKKGCEMCKCNPIKETDRILIKYNITMNDLINILEEYKKNKLNPTIEPTLISILERLEHTSTTTPTTTTSTTTTNAPATFSTTTEMMPEVVVLHKNRQKEIFATEQPKVTPAEHDSQLYIIIGAIVLLAMGVCLSVAGIYIYRNKKKHSHDITPTRGSYQTVTTISENNNIIKRKFSI